MSDGGANSGNTTTADTGDEVKVNIRCSNNSKFPVRVGIRATVAEFKSIIAKNCDVPANQQRLIYKGRILKDDETLDSYGLQEEHAVHLVRGFVPDASSASSTSVDSPASGGQNSNPEIARGVVSSENQGRGGAGLDSLLFPGLDGGALGGASGLLSAGLGFEQMEQQLLQNPNMINDMLNMPYMQNLLNDPDMIRNVIMNNPQMREVFDQNPELAHVLNDPNTLRQTIETARNPELMREMMRNTDRAMSNIESLPEGFNMLRRMYENVQEPLLNATNMTGTTGNDMVAALLGNQVGGQAQDTPVNPTVGSDINSGSIQPNSNPLPNPWSRTSATGGARAGRANVPGIGSLGALGLSGNDTRSGDQVDPSTMIQMLQNPAFTQMMNQMVEMDPQLRGMVDANPQMREAMQNPELLQQAIASVSSLFGMPPQQSPLGSGQGGRGAVPPEELYASQLSQLQEMGFIDTRENIQALLATSGNVNAAVERLLQNFGQ